MLMCQCLSPSSKLIYRSPGLAVSWSRRTVRVVAISMLLAKEWKAVLTRRRRTCQSYIASFAPADTREFRVAPPPRAGQGGLGLRPSFAGLVNRARGKRCCAVLL